MRISDWSSDVCSSDLPKNNGAWFFVEPFIEQCLAQADVEPKRARYAGRKASASPATGLAKRHVAEQGALVADALRHSVREEIKRSEEHTSELQSLMRNSYAVFCLKKKNNTYKRNT